MTVQMDRHRIWAKRWRSDDQVPDDAYLPGHLKRVHFAASEVLCATAESQLLALGLSLDDWRDRLDHVVRAAAALHDLGKSNSQFQNMIKDDTRQARQALRHEWVTLLIIDHPDWQSWLLPAVGTEEVDWAIVRWCIAGHHPKYDRSAPPEVGDGPMRMEMLLENDDMRDIVKWLAAVLDVVKQEEPTLTNRTIDLRAGSSDLDDLYQQHYRDEDIFDSFSAEQRRFVAAVKNCLVASDVAGSALPRDVAGTERHKWIGTVLDSKTLPDGDAYRRIAAARLGCSSNQLNAKLKDERGRFQLNAAKKDKSNIAGRVKLVKAGCGTGKTLAAYLWAETHCDGRRLYICYPTTGTATEGFRDYLLDIELSEHVQESLLKTDLMHGRRQVDFKHILHADEDRNAEIARIESLDLWRIPVVACTVDTVLGVVQNNRRSLFGWPALAQAGFVFDEIHSYDDKLFDALLHFVATVRGVPILLMTASLPQQRKRALEKLLAEGGEKLIEVQGPKGLEQQPRYHLVDAPQPDQLVTDELQAGRKVLRVCNTVAGCMRIAEALEKSGFEPIIYHSRFKYLDRVTQHQRVIEAFNADGSSLAVCTQVAEMSLDLSATLLVSDLAPVPALIQRLGRLNRHAKPQDPTCPLLITDPLGPDGKISPLPYDADDLETAKRWLGKWGGAGQSQRDLAQAWEELQDENAEVARYQSAWLDFGPATPVLELREGSPSVTVVLEEDWGALKSGKATLAEVALPMPIPPAKRGDKPFDWKAGEFNGVSVARDDAVEYECNRGAKWHA